MKSLSNIRAFRWGIVGLALALFAQQQIDPNPASFNHWYLVAALFVGAAIVCIASFRSELGDELGSPPTVSLGSTVWLGVALAVIAILLTVGMALRANVENLGLTEWWLHISSVALFVAAAYLFDDRHSLPRWRWPTLIKTHSVWLLLLILAIAVFFRFYHLDTLPFGVWYDEGMHALLAQRILNEPDWRPIFLDYDYNGPALYAYATALLFNWFGTSIHTMRSINAAFGVFTVLFAYLVGKELFDRRGGLLVAFLFAVGHWSLINSRFGVHTSNSIPLFTLAATFFLLRALRLRRLPAFAWAGFWIGLGFYFYTSYRIFMVVLVVYVLHYIIYDGLKRRANPLDRRLIIGLFYMGVAAILVIMPLALFAWQKPDIFWSRLQEAFILAHKTPDQYWPVISESIRKHLLMFNVAGDQNGRHNLPGAPMLDSISAGLMVVGFVIALWRARRPRYLLLVLWLLVPLSAGILSVDFEAPHSMRSNGAQPAAYLLAILPLYELWRAWDRGAKPFSRWLAVPMVGLMLIVGWKNYDFYFNRYANDFASWNAWSTPETLAANQLNTLPPDTEPYLINYFRGHPSIDFLTNGKPYQNIETTDHLPLDWPPDKNVELMFNSDSRSIYDEARRIYPNATFAEIKPPFGETPALFTVYLTQADIQSIQGLNVRYYNNEDWSGEPVFANKDLQINADWSTLTPIALPFSVEWEGVLHVRDYGNHQFFVRAPKRVELYIGEEQILAGEGTLSVGVVLASGNHAIRLRAIGGAGPINFSWKASNGEVETVPATALLSGAVKSNGLLGRFFPNGDWQAPEKFARIDPELNLYFHDLPLPRPYTVEWSGKIAIPESGDYGFALESIDESTLLIDGQAVVAAPGHNQQENGRLFLEQGLHDLLIRYGDRSDHSHIHFYWIPPGFGQQPVPSQVLFPPQANYERVTVPELAQLYFNQALPISSAPPPGSLDQLPAAVNVLPLPLNSPFGIAAGNDGQIYVADTGNQRLLILNNQGELIREMNSADSPLQEPFDVATDNSGQVYLLDAAVGRVSVYDRDGFFVRNIPMPQGAPERSRGLFVDADGRIWLAHTSGSRVFAVDQQGNSVLNLNMAGEEGAQPIDVAVGSAGNIYVTDGDRHKLSFFSPQGESLFSLELQPANTLSGPHMAVDRNGFLYLTVPEAGRVLKLAPDGQQLGYYDLRAAGVARPVGIGVDPIGKIWVTDVDGGRVVIITPPEAIQQPEAQPQSPLPEPLEIQPESPLPLR